MRGRATIQRIENLAVRAWDPQWRRLTLGACGAALALLVALIALIIRFNSGFAAGAVLRVSSALFVLCFVAKPLSRLVPLAWAAALGRERVGLALAFAGSYAVFLALIIGPYLAGDVLMPLPSAAFAFFSALILAVMLCVTSEAAKRFLGRTASRGMESLAIAYFWLIFAFSSLNYERGPHRPDLFRGVLLTLLLLALLLQFADVFVQRRRVRSAENAA